MGDRKAYLEKALEALQEVMVIDQVSSIYETEPKDVGDEHHMYLNQIISGQTELAPTELMEHTKAIEIMLGRKTSGDLAPRVIDIDILFYNQNRIKSEGLVIPHQQAHKRNFVLVPLVEIAPDFVHPDYNLTVAEILERCRDEKKVNKLED